jgi:hypothetical protein
MASRSLGWTCSATDFALSLVHSGPGCKLAPIKAKLRDPADERNTRDQLIVSEQGPDVQRLISIDDNLSRLTRYCLSF